MGVVVDATGHALQHQVQRCHLYILGFTTSFYTESTEFCSKSTFRVVSYYYDKM